MLIKLASEIVKTKVKTARLKVAKFETDVLIKATVKNGEAASAFERTSKLLEVTQ